VRVACGLPPGLQRLLAGRPPRIDGQALASDIHVLLRLARIAGEESLIAGKTPDEARARLASDTAITAGPWHPAVDVEALEVPGPAGALPARLYRAKAPASEINLTTGGSMPAAASPAGPLLVYFHGGGWVIGDLDTHDHVCRFLTAFGGVRVLSVAYRLAPEDPFPAGVEDAFAGFNWAVEHAPELGASPQRIAVGGDSAGGNLAASVSLRARDDGGPLPAMQLLLYPVTDASGGPSRQTFAKGFELTKDDMDWFEQHYLSGGGDGADPRISVQRAPDLAGLPPAYIATAGFDPLRDEAETYARLLRRAGVRTALRRHPGLIHGFAHLTAISRSSRAAMHEACGALRLGLA
jgi:acetyl esterase